MLGHPVLQSKPDIHCAAAEPRLSTAKRSIRQSSCRPVTPTIRTRRQWRHRHEQRCRTGAGRGNDHRQASHSTGSGTTSRGRPIPAAIPAVQLRRLRQLLPGRQYPECRDHAEDGEQSGDCNGYRTVNTDKALLLSASVLNINGTIQSGQSSNYSVNLDSTLRTTINSLLANTLANVSTSSVTAQAAARQVFRSHPVSVDGERRRHQGRRAIQRPDQPDHPQQRGAGDRRLRLPERQDHQHLDRRIRRATSSSMAAPAPSRSTTRPDLGSSPTPSTPASAPPASSRSSISSRSRRPGTSTMPARAGRAAGRQLSAVNSTNTSDNAAMLQGISGPGVIAIPRRQTSI